MITLRSPLFIVPDNSHDPPKRYLVKDRIGNILFITDLKDEIPEETAIEWAIQKGGWLTGLIQGGTIPSNDFFKTPSMSINLNRPLYIVLDSYERRFLVVDEENNVLFLTDLDDYEPKQTATHAAMQLGGWLKGAVKSIQDE